MLPAALLPILSIVVPSAVKLAEKVFAAPGEGPKKKDVATAVVMSYWDRLEKEGRIPASLRGDREAVARFVDSAIELAVAAMKDAPPSE